MRASTPAVRRGETCVGEALAWGRRHLQERHLPEPDLEARLLLADCLGIGQEQLITRRDEPFADPAAGVFRSAVLRRGEGEPAAYILGRREFWSLDFHVDRRVLVPRPETEGIVEAVLEFGPPRQRVADLGTGSGNIIVALSREVEPGEWYGTDISAEALQVAGLNLRRHGLEGRVTLLEGDLFDALPAGGRDFDLFLSNPPYIPSGDIGGLQREVRLHEPRGALDGGPTGLDVLRRLVSGAPDRLKRGGVLVVEVGAGQGADVRGLAENDGRYSRVESRRDLAGRERIIIAVRV